jgi:hypothetical protein
VSIEQYLLSDSIDFRTKIQSIAEGRIKLDPFSSSREVLMFKDFTSDAPGIYLFPKYSFIHDRNFYLGMYNTMKAKNLISLNLDQRYMQG